MQAGWLYRWQCRSFHHFGPDWNISTTTGWIAMKLCTDMNGVQRMNLSDFGDTLTFRLVLPWGWHFSFLRTCLHNYWMDCHRIWCRQLWRPNDESQWLRWFPAFSSNATITLLGEMSQILLDHFNHITLQSHHFDDPLSFHLAPSSDPNFNFSKTLVLTHIPANVITFPLASAALSAN